MTNEITENVIAFIFGGKAEFTILQEATDRTPEISVRYKISKSKDGKVYFVSTQPIGSMELAYHGYIYNNRFFIAKRFDFNPGDYNEKAINALNWVLNCVSKGNNLPSVVHILHHGKCSRCGRRLKDIESLRCGMGPECRKK